jgi:hypothetical protein
MNLKTNIGAASWIMLIFLSGVGAQDQPQKSIAEVARENREARLRKAVQETVNQVCSKADEPKMQANYPKLQEKCKDKPAFIQAIFESAQKKLDATTEENVKRTEDGLADQTAPADASVGNTLAATPEIAQQDRAEDTQKTIDKLRGLTARQLGNAFARDIQFPGRSEWESKLALARDKFVDAMQADLDVQRSGDTKDARQHADYLLSLARLGFADVQAEGAAKAADWERRTGR